MDRNHITVIGSLNYDIVFIQERLPDKGETLTAEQAEVCSGGKGANQAVQCAKLGVSTYMAGKVGRDSLGIYLKQELESYGVNTKYIKESCSSTGIASVHALKEGSVYSTISKGANYEVTKEDIKQMEALIKNSAILILQLEIPVEAVNYALEVANKYEVYTILNAAPAKPVSDSMLKMVDCLVVNESEAGFYCGHKIQDLQSAEEEGKKFIKKIRGSMVITLGEQGSILISGNNSIWIPAEIQGRVSETTGAGDSYVGGFAFKKFMGGTDEEACRFASKVAGYTVTRIGAQQAMPTWKQVAGS